MELFWTLLYIVLVFEKSRQFCANIFGNTMWRSFLKKGNLICADKLISIERHCHMQINFSFWQIFFLPKDTVVGVANNKEAKKSVWDVDVQDKVQWIFLSRQFINFMFGWMSCKEIRYRLWKLVNDVPDGVDRGVCMGRCSVPRSVQIGSFRWILSISILTVLTVYQQHINRVLTVL